MPNTMPREEGRRSPFLSLFLAFVYVMLICLLLLNNCRGCERSGDDGFPPPPAPLPDSTAVMPDTSSAQPDTTATIPDSAAVNEAERVGHQGNLKVTLLWPFPGDIDLHVMQPNGREISYRRMVDRSTGAHLDVDNREGGSTGSGGAVENAAENIYWPEPPSGQYKVSLVYYSPARRSHRAGSGICKVVIVREGAEPQTFDVRMERVEQRAEVTTVTVD